MALENSCLVCIEELEGAVELNRAFVSGYLLRALYILLSHKVFCLIDTLRHWVILVQVENLTLVDRVLLSNAHWLKVVGVKVGMGNLLYLELFYESKVPRLYNSLQLVNLSEVIDYEKLVILCLKAIASLCLQLKNSGMTSYKTISGIDLHDFALTLAPNYVVKKVAFVLNHGNIFEQRNIIIITCIIEECLPIFITLFLIIVLISHELGPVNHVLVLEHNVNLENPISDVFLGWCHSCKVYQIFLFIELVKIDVVS